MEGHPAERPDRVGADQGVDSVAIPVRAIGMDALGDEHAGPDSIENRSVQHHLATPVAEPHELAFGDVRRIGVIRMNET